MFLRITITFTLIIGVASAATYYVPDDYSTIQDAIYACIDGDVVIVRPGTYVEKIDFLGKAITVQSVSGPEATIIDCQNDGRGFYFGSEGPDSVLSGFTIRNGYILGQGGGIRIENASPTITNCNIENNKARFNSSDPDSHVAGGGIYIFNIAPIESSIYLISLMFYLYSTISSDRVIFIDAVCCGIPGIFIW